MDYPSRSRSGQMSRALNGRGQIKMLGVYMLCRFGIWVQYLDPPTIRTRGLIEPVKSYPQRKKQKGSEPVYQASSTTLEAVS